MSSPPDPELVRRSLRGDQAAFGQLVERHQRRIYNVCLRMMGRPEDAADATQDVFLTALRKLSGFRGASALSTWLHRIAVNTCYDALRRRSREVLVDEPLTEPAPSPDPSGAADARIDVQRALIRVPEDFRAVLVLHDVAGLPYEEVADILGAPVGTVKSRLHRGRVILARILRGEQPDLPNPSNLQENR